MNRIFIFQSIVIGILSHYVGTSFHPIFTFILNSIFSFILYNEWQTFLFFDYFRNARITNAFQTYISTNLVKSSYLLGLCPICLYLITDYDNISSQKGITYIKNMGAIYASLDFSALAYNQKMSQNTVIHHLGVVLFFFANLFDSYHKSSISRMIMLYAIYSTFAYLVNYQLACRLLTPISRYFYFSSFSIYSFLCFLNWTEQFTFLANEMDRFDVKIYSIILAFIVLDDLILLKWLLKRSIL